MQELEMTLTRVIAIGWLIVWRLLIGGLAFGIAIYFLTGFISVLFSVSEETTVTLWMVAGSAVAILWSLSVLRAALRKKYRGFRLALVAA